MPKRFSQQLREAIEAAPVTRYRIAKQLGLDQATLARFMSGERGLRLEAVDDLVELLGLELVARRAPRPGARGKSKGR